MENKELAKNVVSGIILFSIGSAFMRAGVSRMLRVTEKVVVNAADKLQSVAE